MVFLFAYKSIMEPIYSSLSSPVNFQIVGQIRGIIAELLNLLSFSVCPFFPWRRQRVSVWVLCFTMLTLGFSAYTLVSLFILLLQTGTQHDRFYYFILPLIFFFQLQLLLHHRQDNLPHIFNRHGIRFLLPSSETLFQLSIFFLETHNHLWAYF